MREPGDILPNQFQPRRIVELDARHWRLLAEAAVMLTAASVAIAVLRFRRVVRLASPPTRRTIDARPQDQVAGACWAIEAVAWRLPWRTVCFQKGLALHWMLRRRGIASVLHYGIGTNENGAFGAHVWISVDNRIVMGGSAIAGHRPVARYPAAD